MEPLLMLIGVSENGRETDVLRDELTVEVDPPPEVEQQAQLETGSRVTLVARESTEE